MANRLPSTVLAGRVLPNASVLLHAISGSGSFLIETHTTDFDHSVDRWDDVTRDGSTYFTVQTNRLQRGVYVFHGAMVAGAALGLANLSSANNRNGETFKLNIDSGSGNGAAHTGTGIVVRVKGRISLRDVFAKVSVTVIVTNTNPANIETTYAAS